MSTAQSSPPAAAYDPGMRPMHRALPRYIRIAEELQGRIGAGRYEVGGLLPSEPALGREFGVSRTTVRQAIERLHERGLVRPEVGRGRAARSSRWPISTSRSSRGGRRPRRGCSIVGS